jgi:hypothetical protein
MVIRYIELAKAHELQISNDHGVGETKDMMRHWRMRIYCKLPWCGSQFNREVIVANL